MFILFGHDRIPVPIETHALPRKRCEFVDHVAAYTARRVEPVVRDAFEQHLIHCGPCQRAVHLGRISTQLNHHNRSVGMPCAAQTQTRRTL